jgi:hypothetical protein
VISGDDADNGLFITKTLIMGAWCGTGVVMMDKLFIVKILIMEA